MPDDLQGFTRIGPVSPSPSSGDMGGFERLSPSPAPSTIQRFVHGFEAPMVGMDVLASQAEQYIPGMGKTAARDLALAQKERQEFEAQGGKRFSVAEMAGNLANPLNYLIGGPAKGAGLVSTIGRSAAMGAGSAFVQPEHGPVEVAAGAAAGGVLGVLGRAIAGNDAAQIEQLTRSAYYRGVRPGAAMTAPKRETYEGSVRRAVDAIKDTRRAAGQPVPHSPEDFGKAIAEAKTATYNRYTAMAQKAETAGARVDLGAAAARLSKLASDPLQDPAAAAEAKRLLAMIPGGHASITPTRAEEIVEYLNERATGFDTLGTKGAGSVFREAAGALRGSLVDAVSNAGFPEYRGLRQTYGSLATIEDDVGRATTRALNQGDGLRLGLSELSAAGLAGAGEPASAAAVQGVKRVSEWLKSPNRAITKLFEKEPSSPLRQRAGAAVSRVAPAAGAVGLDELMKRVNDDPSLLMQAAPYAMREMNGNGTR